MNSSTQKRFDGRSLHEVLVGQFQHLKQQLEEAYQQESIAASVYEDFSEIRQSVLGLDKIQETQLLDEELNKIEMYLLSFVQKYKNSIRQEWYEEIKHFLFAVQGNSALFRKFQSFPKNLSFEDEENVKEWAESFEEVSDIFDIYSAVISLEPLDNLETAAIVFLNLTASINSTNSALEGYIHRLRRTAGFILWGINQKRKNNSFFSSLRHLGSNQEEQIQNNKSAMVWMKSKLEREPENQELENIRNQEYKEVQRCFRENQE